MRSSALDEDNYNNSNAGKYDSVIIKKISKDKIKNGLKKMFIKLKKDLILNTLTPKKKKKKLLKILAEN